MKRVLIAAALLVISVLGVLPGYTARAASTNNFRITSYDMQYNLTRDAEQRSILTVKETITADFPSLNQNHGIERAIPTTYNGHSVNLKIESVTDETGAAQPYTELSGNDIVTLRVGDKNTYVHGAKTYVLTYTQHDVTRYYRNTGNEEWYWDTNGTQWQVPIDKLTVTVTMPQDLRAAMAESPYCYVGVAGSTQGCGLEKDQSTNQFVTSASSLQPGENITVAFGFQQGTFGQYQKSFFEQLLTIWIIVAVVMSILGVALLITMIVQFTRRHNRTNETNPIAVEFIPPKDASVLVSSQVVSVNGAAFTAQLIDLAVRHYISIIETRAKTMWKAAEYDLEVITDPTDLRDEEKEILSDMFGHLPKLGERLALSSLRSNMSYSVRTMDNDKKLTNLIETTYGIREKSKPTSKYFYKWAIILVIAGTVTLTPWLWVIAGVIALFGAIVRPLTDRGLALRRYVMGLQRYIKASEVERLKFLQGPDTAQKIQEKLDVDNPGQLVKLYERVLPYAILFGYEKQWAARLGEFYQQTGATPDWYQGSGVFNAVMFSAALQSFSQSATYSSGSSSSSGGSSGGGFSGGGGGGGGGGGW